MMQQNVDFNWIEIELRKEREETEQFQQQHSQSQYDKVRLKWFLLYC